MPRVACPVSAGRAPGAAWRAAAVRLAALAVAVGALGVAEAQPDTTATVRALPADSLAAGVGPADSAGVGRQPVAPFGAAPGRAATPVPAVTAALDVQALLAERAGLRDGPAAFAYAVGAPGRVAGVSLDGLAPDAPALTLDGRPVDDLLTGAPRFDLVPLGVSGPVRWGDGALGRAASAHAGLRAFRLGVPVTELRYLGGGSGTRHASGTHAQTRRPPAVLRGGSGLSRVTLTGHAANRASDGVFGGARLRHTDALGRVLVTRPGVAVEAGVLYTDRTEGARAGVVSRTADPAALFSLDGVEVREAGATRRALRAEGWLRARVPLAAEPVEVGVSGALRRRVYVSAARDTLRAHGRRLAAFAEQPLAVGRHRLRLRADVVVDPALGPDAPLVAAAGRTGLHAVLSDSVRIGGAVATGAVGGHRVGGEVWPSAAARVAAGPVSAGVRYGGRARSRLAEAGIPGRVIPAPDATERTLAADAGLTVSAGPWRLALRAFGDATTGGQHLTGRGDSLVVAVVAEGVVRRGGLAAEVGWRESARRGVYARVGGTAQRVSDPAGDVRQRLDAALPRAWGTARVGVRAEDVGSGVLDLDLAAVATGWTAFRSRSVEPATGALVLPEPGGPLGVGVPAQVVVGAEATATFSARTSLFLRYDNALAGRLTDGAFVTQGEPLPPALLRFGVFWALLN